MADSIRSDRENMAYDVVVVGAGPAGLSCAIRLKQMAAEQKKEISVCILEKGSEVGAHLLSGAAFEPRALNELIPDWKEKGAPLITEAKKDQFLFLTKNEIAIPDMLPCPKIFSPSLAFPFVSIFFLISPLRLKIYKEENSSAMHFLIPSEKFLSIHPEPVIKPIIPSLSIRSLAQRIALM